MRHGCIIISLLKQNKLKRKKDIKPPKELKDSKPVCQCAGNLGTCSVFWDSGVIHTGKLNSKPFTAAFATASN